MSSKPMIAVKDEEGRSKVVANLLPCRIHHDGPVDTLGSFWQPTEAPNNTKIAYFRGRKLQGKIVALPTNCRGVVMEQSEDKLQKGHSDDNDDDEDITPLEPIGTMQSTAEFDEMVIWSHEEVASSTTDPYVRSIEEWVQMADKIHSYNNDAEVITIDE